MSSKVAPNAIAEKKNVPPSKTALACPPDVADYPAPWWSMTIWFYFCLVILVILACVLEMLVWCFCFPLGKVKREKYARIVNRGVIGSAVWLNPFLKVRLTSTSWKPTPEIRSGKQSIILVANHRSNLDPFIMATMIFPFSTTCIAKGDLFKIPSFGWGMYFAGDLPVHFTSAKGGWGTKKGSTEKLLMAAEKSLTSGVSMGLCPEGARMGADKKKAADAGEHSTKLMPFRQGFFELAKKLGIPVVPAAIRGADDAWPVGVGSLRPASITMDIGEPFSGDDFADGIEFANAARDKVGAMYASLCKEYSVSRF